MYRIFNIAVAAMGFFVLVPSVHAQSAGPESGTPVPSECAAELVGYAEWPSVEDPSWSFVHERPAGGALHYFGAEHSDDPSHPQFAEIESAYRSFKPTVVFFEGPNRPLGDSRQHTIMAYGESGFVRFLAAQDGVEVRRLEPSPVEEMQEVLKSFSLEQAGLFFLLREAARLRERKDMNSVQIAETIDGMIGQAGQMMPDFPFKSVADLRKAYAKYWSDPVEWWQAPTSWFDPIATGEETGGLFTNAVNRVSSEFRNRYMYEVLASAALDGERVFAVVGRNHVPMQAPGLYCVLQ